MSTDTPRPERYHHGDPTGDDCGMSGDECTIDEHFTTPRPERVTLSDEERQQFENRLRWHFNVVAEEGKGSIYASLGIDNAVLDVERILAAREQALREEERAAWSAWLDAWLGAVGPKRPTVEAVAEALRGGPRPFGIARSETR